MKLEKRIHRMAVLALALLAGTGFAASDQADSPKPLSDQPNILFIFADDQMWDSIGAVEGCPVKTPNLDRLANHGVSFSHTYNMGSFAAAVCVASRTMLNTGSSVWRAATFSSKGNSKDVNTPKHTLPYHIDRETPEALWSQFMKEAGYETYFTGKWHVAGYKAEEVFDHALHVRGGMPGQSKARYQRKFVEGEADNWSPYDKKRGGFWQGGKHWSEVLGDDAVTFLDQAKNRDKPFFMYLAFNAPHDPRQAPKEFVDMYPVESIEVPENFLPEYPYAEYAGAGRSLRDEKLAPFPRTEYSIKVNRQEYFALITHMDQQIGRILDALEASGKADNTYIFFTADHGLAVGDHGFIGKQNMYDSSMRVPMLMTGPGLEAGKTVDAPIYLQDVMATSLELAGVKKPKQVDFNSMMPLATGKTDRSAYDAIYGAYFGSQRMIRTDRYKMIIYPTANRVRLYDIVEDPLEMNDLAQGPNRPIELLHTLFSKFKELQVEMDDPVDVTKFFENFLNKVPPTPLTAQENDPSKPYDGSWEALQKMPVPAWFDDGKIGIFIHWGPYSAIGYRKGGSGYAEHVPKMIYDDPKHYYPYLKERWGGSPPEFGYKDIIPKFKAEKWNPDEWAQLFADVGAKYVVLTAEHHDGWANWDSDLTPWNAADKGPRRDLVGDLGKAVRKQGLRYAPSYHRERHTGFFAEEKYAVHSAARPDIAEEIKRVPEAAMLYGPEFSYNKAYVDDYVARWKEIQRKYQPDMLWVDDFPIYTRDGNQVREGTMKPEIKYMDDEVRGMITDFMNDGAARGQAVYVNNKGANRNWPDGVGCLEKDNLKLKTIGPKWQSCTTFGTSFGYLEGDRYKSIERVLHEMIEVVSRNGNFLINIGPKADGTIAEPQLERLLAMGRWLKINGDAIYGTRYWRESDQKNEHLAFTAKGQNLYAIKLTKPTAPFTITGTAGWKADQVKSVRLLGSDATLRSEMTPQGLQITPPGDLGNSDYAWSFEIVTDREQHHPNVIQQDASKALKGTKKVDLEGNSAKDESSVPTGKGHPIVEPFVVPGATLIVEKAPKADGFKKLPPTPPSDGKVTANQKTNNDPLKSLTDGTLSGKMGPVFGNGIRNGAYKMDLGSVQPVAAITSWSFNMKNIRGPQKVTLYGSNSVADPGWDLSTFTPLGTIDTTDSAKANFTAASLRAAAGQSLGQFRWIVWAVSPITARGGGENTAFQELAVELTK